MAVRQEGRTTFNRLHVAEIEAAEWRYPPRYLPIDAEIAQLPILQEPAA